MTQPKVSFTITASDQTKQAFDSVNSGLGTLKSRADGIFSTFSGAFGGGLLSGLVGVGFGAAVKTAVDGLDKLDEAAERVGVSVEGLSALNFAGKMNGLEFEDMTTALTKLSVKMQEAAAGSKEAGALFSDVGVKVKDANGKIRPAEKVLAEIADRFAGFEDGAAKTALAVDLFGKSGAKLVPLLNGGANGLERMRKEAESLGAVIDSKLAEQAAEFNDNLDKLSFLSGSVSKTIAAQLLPTLNDTAEAFLEAAKSGKNFEAIVRGLAGIGKLPFDLLFGSSSPDLSKTGAITDLKNEIATLENKIKDGKNGGLLGRLVYGDQADLQRKLVVARNQLAVLEKFGENIFKSRVESVGPSEEKKSIARTDTSKNGKSETAKATDEATEYGKAMEALARITNDAQASELNLTKSQRALYDLMTLPGWADMPEAWRQTAVAQFEQAQAAEMAADATKRLNDLLGKGPDAGIDATTADIQFLAKALEDGRISFEQFQDAATGRIWGDMSREIKDAQNELDEFAKSAARNLQSSLANFLFDPFANGTKNMAQQFGDMLRRMAAEAAAASIMRNLFGNMGQSGKSGGSGDWGWIGTAAKWAGSFFADGGVMTSGGPVPLRKYAMGGVATSPQLAMFGEGSTPEAYVPLPDGRRIPVAMQGSGGITINQTIYAGQGTDSAQVRRSAAAGARAALGAMSGAQRYA